MSFANAKHDFEGEGTVKISMVESEDSEPRTIYYLQKLQNFRNYHLVFDEGQTNFPQAREYVRVKGEHIITPITDIVRVLSWEVVPFPSTQEDFPTVAQASRQKCHCSHH